MKDITELLSSPWAVILIAAAVLAIIVIVFYNVIKAASYGRKIWVEAQKQTKLLSSIAETSGVHKDTVKEIMDDEQYREFER